MKRTAAGPVREPECFDASRRLAKIRDRFAAYQRMAGDLLARGVSPLQIARTQFPHALSTADHPPMITVALTNVCNLSCVYCTSPLHELKRGFMSETTFAALLASLRRRPSDRLRIVGNGEATLHPHFAHWFGRLAGSVRYLSIVTNGQWDRRSREATIAALTAGDLVEISVEGDRADAYEASRRGGSFALLLENLAMLRRQRARTGSGVHLNLRLMLRPSEAPHKERLLDFWSRHADSVMPQYIVQRRQLAADADVFLPVHRVRDSLPRCPLIFKDLCIEWDGRVPLCSMSATQTRSEGVFLGNIRDDDLSALWHHPLLRRYRRHHRLRRAAALPMCRGCTSA